MRDFFDTPCGSAKNDGVSGAALEDHLLVQFADARTFGRACEKHAVKPAIGNGAAIDDGHALRTLAAVSLLATRSQVMRGRSSANSSDG